MARDSRGRFTSGAGVAENLRQHVGELAVELTLEVAARVREATPIDTGNAAAQWIESIGAPMLVVADSPDEGRARAASSVATLLSYTPNMGNLYVANPTDYIEFLNGGSSTQAPSGFIEREAAQAQQIVQDRHRAEKVPV